MNWKRMLLFFGVPAIVAITAFYLFANCYANWLWFQNIGFSNVYGTMLWAKILIFCISALMFFIVTGINILIARSGGSKSRSFKPADKNLLSTIFSLPFGKERAPYMWLFILLLFSYITGIKSSNEWLTILKFMNHSQFGITDPIFLKDAGFYVYTFPFYIFLKKWCLFTLLFVFCSSFFSYYLDRAIMIQKSRIYINYRAKTHLTVLVGLTAMIMALSYRLKIYELMYSDSGVVQGASYADIHAQLPAYWVLTILCLLMAFIFFIMPILKRWKWAASIIALYFVVLIGFSWLYPQAIERYVVKPNEFTKETPYIENNIRFTRFGFGLDKAREELFPFEDSISNKDLKDNESTINNIRLWDHRPLIQTYKQLQEMRLYYNFKNVDMDRYTLENQYTEVALAGRELSVSKLPDRAKTWVNTHLVYTHGYGVVMSPVNEFTSDGMPNFNVQDIPPKSSTSISIIQPEIYYGEETDGFAIVKTSTKEFDYPKGDQNVYTTYHGNGGVQLSNFFRRLVYSVRLSDLNILLSDGITDQSRIMYNRTIQNRDRIIAPFLKYDSDPYMVVDATGRLYWIHDAYTTTNMFPFSQPLSGKNYIRNSVKVVVDAYDGNVSYYITDPSDTMIQTYLKIFPTLFKPIEAMPESLRAHLRYPKDMFITQAKMYTAYHMTDPQVFYNREDLWSIPQGLAADTKQSMLPYYIIMKLPDSETEEFILMLPMTPSKKDNMVSWMCARCDGNNRGQLLIYTLPKDRLIYGPRQIEARINQEPSITSEMTLWGQLGSSVIRGNLLIIPIAHSFMYVEPVYLQSKEGEIPQLKRVVVAQNEQLKMEKDLDSALRAVFSEENMSEILKDKSIITLPSDSLSEKAKEALDHYNKAQEYLNQANWSEYGDELDQIQRILQDMTENE